jgi:medium-chain acyl-[acyl-carrier-protein] hydrolase
MIHSETYRIRNYEADTHGRLGLHSLANYLQDAADRHAIELGAGVPQLLEQGLSWVLYRIRLDINQWPRLSEEVTVTTHPSGEERVYVYRDYQVVDSEGNLLVSASSTWLVFDLAKRKLTLTTPQMKEVFKPYHTLAPLPRANSKYPSLPDQWQFEAPVTARHSEIDQNQHVNNSVYFQWLLEPLPVSFLLEQRCTSIDITFKAECIRGDVVLSRCAVLENGQLIHRIGNESGDELVTAVSSWVAEM